MKNEIRQLAEAMAPSVGNVTTDQVAWINNVLTFAMNAALVLERETHTELEAQVARGGRKGIVEEGTREILRLLYLDEPKEKETTRPAPVEGN